MDSQWLWPFELEERIGEGGMGVVYRGRYVKNDRRVAVKLVPKEVTDPTVLARFEREVKILTDLRHPNIVHCFGGVCEDERRFYAMELVEGGSLEEMLGARGGRLPWEQVVEFGLQMCAALHYAHERGVVHRDLKPGNFLLTKSGKLKLSDFGLATIVAGSNLTSDGRTVGSFRYMSPEQVRGTKEPMPATDLYSLGCVLMKLLTGSPPFDGNTAGELLNKHLSAEPPRVAALAPDCPASLDKLVGRLLSKDPADRPADALEVAKLLKSISLVTTLSGDETKESILQQKRVAMPAVDDETSPRQTFVRSRTTIGLAVLAGFFAVWALVGQFSRGQSAESERLWIQSFQSQSSTRERRLHAAESLGILGAHSRAAVDALEKGLSDADARMREAAATALGTAAGNAKATIPPLMQLQKNDDEPLVRSAAATALKKIRDAPSPTRYGWYAFWTVAVGAIAGGIVFAVRRNTARNH